MIYTVTFNPAVDYCLHMDDIKVGEVNRARGEEIYFGGKGINVSFVLKELGIRSRALGFVAGFTGRAIEQGLWDGGIETDFVHLEQGFSRINVKLKTSAETDLNGRGPEIPAGKLEEFFVMLDAVKDGDTVVLSGSIPPSLPADTYEKILKRLAGRRVRTVVDAAGELLLNTLKYRPFLVKPNHFELGEIFGAKLDTTEKIVECADRLKSMGAVNVLVSRAGKGAVLVDERGKVHVCGACSGTVRNSVGAGDSMVAGFLAGCEGVAAASDVCGGVRNEKERSESGPAHISVCDYGYALRLGTAAGGAAAFSDGLARREEIFRLLSQLT
ncbi:MAG: 1-phosphofructokinase [Lachnospiraceae bacterium]|nr:1-phosphofructokinase [Lachnospiraceae bacterium]